MARHSALLRALAAAALSQEQLRLLVVVTSSPGFAWDALVRLDASLGGVGFSNVSDGRTGRYDGRDRDVFRPLQYCEAYFSRMAAAADAEWFTRDVVQMSGLYLESLVKRVSGVAALPLGQALHHALARARIDPVTWAHIRRFSAVYNASKHDVGHPKDAHLFDREDAVTAYVVARVLGERIAHLAALKTDITALANGSE